MISDYFSEFKQVLVRFSHVIFDYEISEKRYSEDMGFITGKIRFFNHNTLEFGEVINTRLSYKVKYRYHFMDQNGQMLFRYDNSKHFPNINTFPHHKHTPDGVIQAQEPNMTFILKEIEIFLLRGKK